jgi:hypothetical protein
MIHIGLSDWLILLMWFFIIGTLIVLKNAVWKSAFSRYLFPAYLLKVMGGVAFVLVYFYYYDGGDTFYYFQGADRLSDILFEHPLKFFQLLLSNEQEAAKILHQLGKNIVYTRSGEEWFMVKLVSPFTIIGMKSFLATTFFLSLFSLMGTWKLFKLMNKIIVGKPKLLFAISFLIPSVLFWGSGIMKDTVTMSCFFFLVAWLYSFVIEKKWNVFVLITAIIFMFIVFKLKAYILICFMPWIFVTLFLNFIAKMPTIFMKFISIPFLLIILSISSFFISSFVVESSTEYNSDRFFKNMKGFHEWNTYLGGSVYSLGEMEYSISGIIFKAPQAVNVTLFRPYFWEAKTSLVLLSAVESFTFLLITLWTLVKIRFRPLYYLLKSPFLSGGFVFCMTFSFAIGLTAYNFGALTRFKIPLMGIYLFILFFLVNAYNTQREINNKTD